MEAKVDIRKLQLLNDRISQTIDALNQVRLSVHGLSHSPVINPQMQMGTLGIPYTNLGQQFTVPGYNIAPNLTGMTPTYGLQHTAFNPYVAAGVNPLLNPTLLSTQTPWISAMTGGLMHTPSDILEQRLFEMRAADPLRITQTFPFANVFLTPNPVAW